MNWRLGQLGLGFWEWKFDLAYEMIKGHSNGQLEMCRLPRDSSNEAVIPAHLDSHIFGYASPIGVWLIWHETRLIMAHFFWRNHAQKTKARGPKVGPNPDTLQQHLQKWPTVHLAITHCRYGQLTWNFYRNKIRHRKTTFMKKPTPNYVQNLFKNAITVTVHGTVDLVILQFWKSASCGFLTISRATKLQMEWFKKGNSTRQNKEQLSCLPFLQIPNVTVLNRTVNLGFKNWNFCPLGFKLEIVMVTNSNKF